MTINTKALDIILRNEGFAMHPMWPGGASGITWGYGWDSGYHTLEELFADWIDPGRITCPSPGLQVALRDGVGLTGTAAQAYAPTVRECFCLEIDARIVFEQVSIPKYEALTVRAFPGAEQLPDEVYGALVSLVFNRGGSMGAPNHYTWDTRREMREIRDAVAQQNLPAIAEAIRSMKRLWVGKGLDGLLSRRDQEAALVEEAVA